MYLLDYKIPKYLQPLSDEIYKDFKSWLINTKGKSETPTMIKTSRQAVDCFIKNTSFLVSCGKDIVYIPRKKEVYSQELIYNGTKINRQVSYAYTMLLCDFLVDYSKCAMSYGGVFWEFDVDTFKKTKGQVKKVKIGSKFTTGIKLSPTLLSLFSKYQYKREDVPLSVIEIRDEEGNVVSKKLTQKQIEIIKILTDLNMAIVENDICLQGNKLDFSVKKVYNNSSFKYGGRNYIMGNNAKEAQGRETRLEITINKQPCVEVDYRHLHPSILADLVGEVFPNNFDPYTIDFEGLDKTLLRDLAKKGLLILINTPSVASASAALSSAISEEPLKSKVRKAKMDGLWPDGRVVHTIIEKLIEHNGYLMNNLGVNAGLELMNIESQMCDIVIEKTLMEGEVLIPLHDGFIVQESNSDMVVQFMKDAYDSVIGGVNCRINIKKALA